MVGKAEVATAALATMEENCQEEMFHTLNVHKRGNWADKGKGFQWWKFEGNGTR